MISILSILNLPLIAKVCYNMIMKKIKCKEVNCNREVFNKKRKICSYHYGQYLSEGLLEDKIDFEQVSNKKKHIDLTGQKFGLLFVNNHHEVKLISKKPRHFYKCTCECGKETIVLSKDLITNHTKSCGLNCEARFLQKLNLKQPNREYIIKSKYKGFRNKILIKNKYGECLVNPCDLLLGKKGSISNSINKNKYFINIAKEIHGDKYDYSKVDYINGKSNIKIICKEHGEFLQTPNIHLTRSRNGCGCPQCGLDKRGWGIHNFIKACDSNNKKGLLYIIKCWNDEEEFYKIGITSRNINDRYKTNTISYEYDIVLVYWNIPEIIWKLEKNILYKYIDYKYTPKVNFGGRTECLNIKLPIEEIKTFIKNF